jgi:hypothetical protein
MKLTNASFSVVEGICWRLLRWANLHLAPKTQSIPRAQNRMQIRSALAIVGNFIVTGQLGSGPEPDHLRKPHVRKEGWSPPAGGVLLRAGVRCPLGFAGPLFMPSLGVPPPLPCGGALV